MSLTGISLMVAIIACALLLGVVVMIRSESIVMRILGVVLALWICGAILVPRLERPQRSPRLRCMNNLSQIGKAAQIFAFENKERLPTSLGELTNYLGSAARFRCSAERAPGSITNVDVWSEYTIVTNATPDAVDCVLAYCNPTNHEGGTLVLYTDHSVQWINTADFPSLGVDIRNLSRAATNSGATATKNPATTTP